MTYFLIIYLILSPLVLGSISYLIASKKEKIREYLFIGITLAEMTGMIILLIVNNNSVLSLPLMGLGLSFRVDAFRAIYATVSIFLWLMTITFSKEYMHHYNNKTRYYMFYLITLSGVVGVFMSNDLYTTFVFFEIMSIASYPLVIHDEKKESMEAGKVYLAIAIITGMVLLMGLFLIYNETNTLDFELIRAYSKTNGVSPLLYAGGILALFGFGAKAGMYPLHVWLPKAHPVAPAPASALLSGILTKTGVFGIIVLSSSIFFSDLTFAYLLLLLAVITMFLGALLALFSTNLKRTLACSSMSQIGFILVGIAFYLLLGEEGGIASNGALLHMVNHSLIKLVLFMCAGVVVMNIHKLELNEIQGFGRKKYFLMVIFLIGALGIMGVPFFNGYVSKTMIHEAIVEYIKEASLTGGKYLSFKAVEGIFLLSGGLTVAYMSKLFICIFIKKNSDEEVQKSFDEQKKYMSPLSKGVFVLSVIMLPVIGLLPNVFGVGIASLSHGFFFTEALSEKIGFFSWECLKGGLISIGIGVIIYLVFVQFVFIRDKKYVNLWPEKLDMVTLIYNPLIRGIKWIGLKIFSLLDFFFEPLIKIIVILLLDMMYALALIFDYLVYIIRKSVMRPVAYSFNDSTFAYRLGALIDRLTMSNGRAERYENERKKVTNGVDTMVNSFSFALGMACFGLVIIILFIIFRV